MERRALWILVLVLAALQIVQFATRSRYPPVATASTTSAPLADLEQRLAALEFAADASTPQSDEPARVQAVEPRALAARVARLETVIAGASARRNQDAIAAAAQRKQVGKLTTAIASGDAATARALLADGLDVNARDDDRQTPLGAAAVAGRLDLIDILLANEADLERKTGRRGLTPLLAALDADQEEAALALIDRGANPAAADKNGENALEWASFNGATKVVSKLLRSGSRVNARSHDGATALYSAARRGHESVVSALLRAGADPNLATKSGSTPLAIARAKGHDAVAALLRRSGARK